MGIAYDMLKCDISLEYARSLPRFVNIYNMFSYDLNNGKLINNDSAWITPRTLCKSSSGSRGCCGHDRMVVGFTTTYAITAYHH